MIPVSVWGFGYFEMQEVHTTDSIAGDNQIERVEICLA